MSFLSKDSPEYVKYMLSESYTRKAGIFNYNSISGLISKIEKTGVASEIDNMVLTSVISTHCFIINLLKIIMKNFKRIEESKKSLIIL